jgi:hypothetical protein
MISAQAAWHGIKETTNSADLAAPRESVVRELVERARSHSFLRNIRGNTLYPPAAPNYSLHYQF